MTPASTREQLTAMLCEAAEIEHCLMCTYLYAAFSLKQSDDEGLSATELTAVRHWRSECIRIATDEMLHLALVNNLLIALGLPPHYRRFNFPISAGLFPADVAVALAPFDEATLDHFVYLERPLDASEQDAAPVAKSQYQRSVLADRLSAFADDYRTVGELYEAIEASFARLVELKGCEAIFIGPVSSQLSAREFRLIGLHTVTNLGDVRSAVHLIRHQGEGSSAESAGSHYGRFCTMRREWQALKAANPNFAPTRPAARNPVMRSPIGTDRVQIVLEPASQLVDVANASYALMIQLLVLLSDGEVCKAGLRNVVADQNVALMHLIVELGSQITRLPANPDYPGVTAGISFTSSRGSHGYPTLTTAAFILEERFTAIAGRLKALGDTLPLLKRYANGLSGFASFWRMQRETESKSAVAISPIPVPVPTSMPASVVTSDPVPVALEEIVRGHAAEIRFNAHRCIHSRHCVLDEPGVFVANKPGEWIYPDSVSAERVARVALNCPSGAIHYTRLDGGEQEQVPPVNQLRIRENGPLAIHAEMLITGQPPETRATLCRCGQSRNKPYCDGSHNAAGFVASGEPVTRESQPLAQRNGPLQVVPLLDGPLEVTGNLEICAGTGRTVDRIISARLCRCGQSGNKPFCDGSHAVAGFKADGG